jgi:hypothetical protein
MTTYRYNGDGAGLPGLPNEVSEEEAQKLGMADVLKNAVAVGLYVEVKGQKSKVEPKGKGDVSNG